jgi:hypothetical protein
VVGDRGFYAYLVGLDSTTLQLKTGTTGNPERTFLNDPRTAWGPKPAGVFALTSSPMVGPDGDVYFGVLGNPDNGGRGFLLHFSGDLSTEYAPGAFGFDDTASVVPASMVPSYHGPSSYLVMTKYNNYAGGPDFGLGDGVNQIAVLDPHATQLDTHNDPDPDGTVTLQVMKEVLTIAGPTPDVMTRESTAAPNAVTEWCINTAVVDPGSDSVYVNNEDGYLYRWDLATNTLDRSVNLTAGILESYTPTAIDPRRHRLRHQQRHPLRRRPRAGAVARCDPVHDQAGLRRPAPRHHERRAEGHEPDHQRPQRQLRERDRLRARRRRLHAARPARRQPQRPDAGSAAVLLHPEPPRRRVGHLHHPHRAGAPDRVAERQGDFAAPHPGRDGGQPADPVGDAG